MANNPAWTRDESKDFLHSSQCMPCPFLLNLLLFGQTVGKGRTCITRDKSSLLGDLGFSFKATYAPCPRWI